MSEYFNPNENERRCPPEVRALISQMEQAMNQPEYNHAGVPTEVAIHLVKEGIVDSFADVEKCMRDLDSRSHFIAVPADYYGEDLIATYPNEREDEPEYALYITVNGTEEAESMLEHIGITREENLERLKNTGIPTIAQK